MKIAQLCPLWETVPPKAYGGIELVVSLLTDGLADKGIQVTLFASGNSESKGELRALFPLALRELEQNDGNIAPLYELAHLAWALDQASDCDLIHNHCGYPTMLLSRFTDIPILTTHHGNSSFNFAPAWTSYTGHYVTISHAAKGCLPDKNYLGVVYNGIDCESFKLADEKEGYLLFLSRISPEKGTHHAINVAKKLGMKLIIAGKVDKVDREYFQKQVAPNIDGKLIQFVGEANTEQKRELYAKASCLLFPITWEDPFGLVLPEAMASGTPVIAFPLGSVPEIVLDKETGYIVDDEKEMIEAVKKLDKIDPKRCRNHVEENFSVDRMIEDYIAAYEYILDQGLSPRPKGKLLDNLTEAIG